MAEVSVTGKGASLEQAIKNAKQALDDTFGEGNWETDSSEELRIDITPYHTAGLSMVLFYEIEVTVYARADAHPSFAHLP